MINTNNFLKTSRNWPKKYISYKKNSYKNKGNMKVDRSKNNKAAEWVGVLSSIQDPSDQLHYLLELGMEFSGFPEIRKEDNKIKGCQTNIWIGVDNSCNEVLLDSDSLIIKGVLYIILDIFQNSEISDHMTVYNELMESINEAVIDIDIKKRGLLKVFNFLEKHNK
jgi:cysteine desulfuration protein SufE